MNEPVIHQAVTPTAVYPAREAPLMPVEGRRIVGYERYAGDLLVPVYEAPAPAVRTETVVVQRGVDKTAQQMAAGGVLAAGVGLGIDLAGHGIGAVLGGGGGTWVLIVLFVLARAHAVRTTVHNHTTVNNSNRWLGRSTTNTRQR